MIHHFCPKNTVFTLYLLPAYLIYFERLDVPSDVRHSFLKESERRISHENLLLACADSFCHRRMHFVCADQIDIQPVAGALPEQLRCRDLEPGRRWDDLVGAMPLRC